MHEALVQWTLLNNLDHLSRYLNFKIATKKAQQLSTKYGRIDFILEGFRNNQIIVELETLLNDSSKLNYCFNQMLNYRNVKFVDDTDYCILYASETILSNKIEINTFAEKNDIKVRTYSLNDVKSLYSVTVERLSLSFGLALPKPANYTICYLRWLNKILKPYYDSKKNALKKEQLAYYFNSQNSTNFRCYMRLALDFEVIIFRDNKFHLTQYGKDYIDNFNLDINLISNLSSNDLTNEQKKVLLKVLTNSNWTPHKVNIYWFLRFIEVTGGEWLPNIRGFDDSKLEIINSLFNVNYKARTMYEFLNFACNWCMELGLVERIKTGTRYDRIFLTPLGIEVNNIFSMDLQMKKSRMNLNFKYRLMLLIEKIEKAFSKIMFEVFEVEHSPDLCGDIDYLGWVGDKAFGIQIKPVTAKANFGNYSPTERMRASFEAFTQQFGGKVFIVFSLDGEIGNTDVLNRIDNEIARLKSFQKKK